MKTVTIHASKTYDVHIGSGLLDELGTQVAALGKAQRVCIVSDSNVWPLFGAKASGSLRESGFCVTSFVFPAGEESKNGQTFLELVNFLAENQLTRSDILVALGGGVVGDLAGFAAASFLRGIRFVQIPTTLLAMVDSSVGGKTAIDLPAGKNLCGAFCQPSLVLCDTDVLNTLPIDVFRDGCAEVIKYGVLYDADLLRHLQKRGLAFDREMVIERCVAWKRSAVEADEFDTGPRKKLNLGHTIGHCVEARSHFTLSHGKAVAIGMAIVARTAKKRGICSPDTCDTLLAVLNIFGLPSSTQYPVEDIFSYSLSDKKRSGDTVRLIVPTQIGNCEILPTPVAELKAFIQEGL